MPPKTARRPAPAAVSTMDAARPWLRGLVLLLASLIVFNWFYSTIGRSDFWWHLKTGQYIWQHHALPVPDPFSYTTYMGQPAYPGEDITRYFNLTHEWLAQIVLYLVYSEGGPAGVILFRQTLLAGLCGIVGLLVYRRCGGFYRAICAALAAAPVASFLIEDRPYLITYFLLGVTLLILESRRHLWLLPPIFLVWANCHSGFFLGWVAMGAYCAEAILTRRKERQLFLATAASLLASGLNPNGYRVFQVLLLYRHSPLQMRIFEWQRPSYWEVSAFTAVLYGAAAVLLWARRRVRISDWLLYLVFAAAALSAARNIILIGIIGPLIVFSYLPWKWRLPVVVDWAAAVLLAYWCWVILPRPPLYGVRDWELPSGAADFLLNHHIRGRMLNTYDAGGYLIWRLAPDVPVFLDGRALNESVAADQKRIVYNADSTGGPSGQELLARYGIDLIAMPMLDGMGDVYLLPASLSDPSQKTWTLIYRDAQSVIFVKSVPPGVVPLNSLEALSAMEMQCQVTLDHGGFARCARSVSRVFAIAGDNQRAAQWMAVYRQRGNQPDSPLRVR